MTLPNFFRSTFSVVVTSLFTSLTWGCADETVPQCTPGESEACACADGTRGAQTCADDGTFDACACQSAVDGGLQVDAGEPPNDAGTPDDGGTPPQDAPHDVFAAFSARLAGLWTGPATQTVLGDFPIMIMDFRAVDDAWVFCRVDLDAGNNLRFLFDVEDVGGRPSFVYRNGGNFQNLFRDSRTVLEEARPDAGYFRFCALDGGCDFIDAVFNFTSPTRLEFDATVRGDTHVVWNANRDLENALPAPFPSTRVVEAGADFPLLPRAEVSVTFPAPDASQNLLVALATPSCTLTSIPSCKFSRSYVYAAAAGETTATIPFEQLHPGAYQAVAILDNDGIAGPSSGDAFSLLSPLNVPDDVNATATASVQVFDF